MFEKFIIRSSFKDLLRVVFLSALFFCCWVGASVAALSPPSNLRHDCSADGQSVVIRWDAESDATSYMPRLDYLDNNSPVCGGDGWYCDALDYMVNGFVATQVSHSVVPDKPYGFWVHSSDGTVHGVPSGINFTCPLPTPGSEAYCNDVSNPQHALEEICILGSVSYCKLDRNKTKPECIVGNEEFCKLQHNKSNPACIVGSNEFCALPQHENHVECPGTISYCTKYPQSRLCTPTDINPPCVGLGNCTTPYQVHITSKSSPIGIVLCEAIYYMKSGIGSAIAILAMIMMAILVVYRKIDAAQALIMVAGVAAVLGAAHLAAYMANTVAGFSTTLNCLIAV